MAGGEHQSCRRGCDLQQQAKVGFVVPGRDQQDDVSVNTLRQHSRQLTKQYVAEGREDKDPARLRKLRQSPRIPQGYTLPSKLLARDEQLVARGKTLANERCHPVRYGKHMLQKLPTWRVSARS